MCWQSAINRRLKEEPQANLRIRFFSRILLAVENTANCCLPAASALRAAVFLISPAVEGWLLSADHLFLRPLPGEEMKYQPEAAQACLTPSGLLSSPHITFKCVSS